MPKSKKNTYGNESIERLKGADRVRKRPGVIFGSDDIEGCIHGFFEILSNSTDEAKAGYGDRIEVTRFADGSIQVRDFGRGVPLDFNKAENEYNYMLVYAELYAGGKMDAMSGGYDYSLGLNGLGACATQYASEYFEVTSVRDGYEYNIRFEKGNPVGELKKKRVSGVPTGTTQKWKPDMEVFTDVDIPAGRFTGILHEQAVVNKGITYVFLDEETGESTEYCYPDGILGYIRELSCDTMTEPYLFSGEGSGRDRDDKPEYSVKGEVAFCFSNQVQKLQYFHNSSNLEHGGSPDKAVRAGLLYALDQYAKSQKKYTKSENKITFNDIADSLILVTNTFSTQTSYENQTKKAINNKFIQEFLTALIKEQFSIWMIEHKAEADRVINQVLINKRSRESSESQRIQVKKKLMQKTDVTNKVKKFVDCRSKDPGERELFICEGDSALSSLIVARDASFQALMPVRGKILNLEKASLQQTFGSDVIMDLIRVLGCGIEMRGKKAPKDIPPFNIEKLNYNKVIFAADEDVDGAHIRTLLLVMLYKLCPQLIENGYVYYINTPLFEITDRSGKTEKTMYAFTDAERDRLIKGKDPKKLVVQRSKGLGENDAAMMARFISAGTRRLTRVTAAEAKEMEYWVDLLMGNDVAPRKAYIQENGHLYMDNLDVS